MLARLWTLAPGLAVAAADQLLKAWSTANLPLLKARPIAGQSTLSVTRVLNRGIAFDEYSMLPDGAIEAYTRYLPTGVFAATLACVAARWPWAKAPERVGWGLLLACGGSNLWDHWRANAVIDTLLLDTGSWQRLPFNVADAGLLAGTALVTALLVREAFARPKSPAA